MICSFALLLFLVVFVWPVVLSGIGKLSIRREPYKRNIRVERAFGEEVTPAPKNLKYGVRVKHSQSSTLWFLKSKDRFRKEPSSTGKRGKKDIVFSWSDPWPYVTYSLQCLGKYKKEMKKRER